MVVFLGGTCNGSTWRDKLIPTLDDAKIDYFNPVVEDWTPDDLINENRVKALSSTIELYVITSEMTGVYSIAEAVQASIKKPGKTIFCVLDEGFDNAQRGSLVATSALIKANGARVCTTLAAVVNLVH